jgi:putative ABC transport system substrate-binding protein
VRRREFITLLGGAAALWPLAGRAQPSGKLTTIGFLGGATEPATRTWLAAFVQRLRELGWIEGRTIEIQYRWAEGRSQRAAELAADLVRLKVNIIVTNGATFVIAAKQATSTIPIVFAAAGDPVAAGIVSSLARPGGNVTGMSVQSIDLAGKRLEILREILPSLRRVALLAPAANPTDVWQIGEAQAAARTLGLEIVPVEIRGAEDIGPVFETLKGSVDALYVSGDPLMTANRIRINTLAQGARLPTIYNYREFVDAGGLVSYGPNFPDMFRRAAEYVDKILRGRRPDELPVEQPTKFDLFINLTTAKTLGLTIPPLMLARAEVIE